MAENKVTMVIKVDLKCSRCYKKIKKVLCKFPEIRDQVYDEKQNKVQINVISCFPERIRQKIACKGGKTVEGIEIVPEKKEGVKPEEAEKKKKEGDKPKDSEQKDAPTRKPIIKVGGGDKPIDDKKKGAVVHKDIAEPVSGYFTFYPSGMYYQPPQLYYQGYGTVPYCLGVPVYYSEGSYGVGRGYNTNCCDYFSEENPESCTVM